MSRPVSYTHLDVYKRQSVYRIAVLAEQEAERQRYAEQITRFCEAKGLFPQVMQYDEDVYKRQVQLRWTHNVNERKTV